MEQPENLPTFPQLQPGDHIYCERKQGLYDHHGIYVGDDMVVHIRGAAKKLEPLPPCEKCGNKRVINGERAKTCMYCFLDGYSPPRVYDYGIPYYEFEKRPRGTCTYLHSRAAQVVIKTATDLLTRNDFGPYNILTRNCENFAVYCKTGNYGPSQQVNNAADNIMKFMDALAEALGSVVKTVGTAVVGVLGVAAVITHARRRS